ncbi:DUF4395 domain-containing protein [Microbispora sp. RL4-1S]|uniref:DUF4395 domain-containing protein n=1 Tax=Microbispora oryzae TaxID=2806554 RepID=A0A940WG39_9ACTN|nr:DUF4395 domain-containing protein [Microbispora oryzae]MBP2705004.1 DUF4395 domain-containing protein [Microbispora oryzae]
MHIDPRGPRFGAAITTLLLAAVLVTGSPWLLAVQTIVFSLGAFHSSPYVAVYRRYVRPRLGPPRELEDPRPPRFAQGVGLVFATVGLIGFAAGITPLALGATAVALLAAFLNAAFGFCLGCEMYLMIRRLQPGRTQ